MKKSLSLVLAAIIAFGGAISAFAVPDPTNVGIITPQGANVVYKWSSSKNRFTTMSNIQAKLNYGTTFGFMIGNGSDAATKADQVKGIKAYPEYNMTDSKNLVEKVAVEYKKYDDGSANGQYAYFVTMKTKSSNTASTADLNGTMRVGKSSTDSKTRAEIDFGFQLDNSDDGKNLTSSYQVKDSTKVLDFADQGDIDITFTNENGNDQATFEVDATGQSKLNCGYTVKYNAEFAAKYPAANLEFISWGATPSFNRIGTLQIYADPDTYLYQITEDGFREVSANYDETYEAFVIKTRTLGAYVISDIELEAEVIDEVPVSSAPGTNPPTGGVVEVPNNGGKPNPNTGR